MYNVNRKIDKYERVEPLKKCVYNIFVLKKSDY